MPGSVLPGSVLETALPDEEIDLLAETQSLVRYQNRFYPVSRLGMESMRELCLMGVETDRILYFILRQEGYLS